MESIEVSAKTVEEAIAKALEQLNVRRPEVQVEILSEGRAGIWGLGAEDARVRVTAAQPLSGADPQVAVVAMEVLGELLDRLHLYAAVEETTPPPEGSPAVALDVRGEDMGILIGRRGQTLATLQYMVNLIVSHRLQTRTTIWIDVEGYRKRRWEALQVLAARAAERVRRTGEAVTLEPMPASERRIIHLALQDHSDIITQSIGEGESRKVSISLRRQP